MNNSDHYEIITEHLRKEVYEASIETGRFNYIATITLTAVWILKRKYNVLGGFKLFQEPISLHSKNLLGAW